MSYREFLAQTIEQWKAEAIEDEWLFEKFREAAVGAMTSAEAFDALDETIEYLLGEQDESTSCEIVQTVICLARKSETTEVPGRLLEHKKLIEHQFDKRGDYSRSKMREMFRWYRL